MATRAHAHGALSTIPPALALLLVSCSHHAGFGASSNPGGPGGPGGPGLNGGQYDIASFGYVDPHPADFQPFGKPVFTVLGRDEVATLVKELGQGWLRDDASQGFAETTSKPWGFGQDMVPYDGDGGDLDGDGRPELLFVGQVGGSAKWEVGRLLQSKTGDLALFGSFGLYPASGSFRAVRMELADVDGDGRDEIILAAALSSGSSWVRVYEDTAESQIGSLAWELPLGGREDVRATAGQLDEDPALELVVYAGDGEDVEVRVLDDATTGFAPLAANVYEEEDAESVEVLTGNFDGDPQDEIVVFADGGTEQVVFQNLNTVTLYDDAENAFAELEHEIVDYDAGLWDPYDRALLRRIAVADLDGDGFDELVWLRREQGGFPVAWHLRLRRWSPDLDEELDLVDSQAFAVLPGFEGTDLTVLDDDADGVDEVVVLAAERRKNGDRRVHTLGVGQIPTIGVLGGTLGGQVGIYQKTYRSYGSGGSGAQLVPVVASEDVDHDGTRLRWTGTKYPCLPNPIPIVVIAAPPTKAGIGQVYDATEVSYGVEATTAESFQVSTGTSVSTAFGFEFQDVFGNGVAAKTTMTKETEQSLGHSSSVSTSTSFLGSFDQDYVVFQGTLYTCYEYEVVAAQDPLAIGSTVTLDVPVGAKTFKWTLDLYDQTFGDAAPIDPDAVLGHTIGDPTSYSTRGELVGLLDSEGGPWQGWEGERQTIGQGTSAVGLGLALGEVLTQAESVTYSVDNEVEYKVGGATAGASYGVSQSSVYEISLSSTTSYDARIGDIVEPAEWNAWAYDVGIVAYTRRVPGELPYQVLRFWTDPWGSGYSE